MKEGKQHTGLALYVIYVVMLIGGLVAMGKIIYLQTAWKPNEKIARAVTPQTTRNVIDPIRGDIYDCKGRILAMSYPVYVIHLDCTVGADAWWEPRAKALSAELPKVFPGRSANDYYRILMQSREKGRKYLTLGKPVDHRTLGLIEKMPLLKEGRNRGGIIVEQKNTRRYPYGTLARRTIGFVRTIENPEITNNKVGLEGHYDDLLKGKPGYVWLRQTDKGQTVRNYDSTLVEVVNGSSIVTTLDIDIQELADAKLRAYTRNEPEIDEACLVLMDVRTGAIRAMVNLNRNPRTREMEETQNIAIGRRHEPGSIFKTVTLAAVLQDGYLKTLDMKIPTNHGDVEGTKHHDIHIKEWERDHHTSSISVLDGFKISSNYVFATLAIRGYGASRKDQARFVECLKRFHLTEKFSFDLDGLQSPNIPSPQTHKYFTNNDLGAMGFGYSTEETPLQMLMFYNAIAGKGRMMKPYLVEGSGRPIVLDEQVFRSEVADTLTRALKYVASHGTARAVKDAAAEVAAKTGTSFATFQITTPSGKKKAVYTDSEGRRKYQGSLAGFFPADDPQYSFICCVYTNPTKKSFQGGGIPAKVMKEVIDGITLLDPYWRNRI